MKLRKHFYRAHLISSLFILSSGAAIGAVPVSSQSKLIADDAFTGSAHGWIVSSDGNTAVVSAFADYDGLGAAYVYERTDSGWQQASKLTASDGSGPANGEPGDSLGMGASISGNTIILGAPLNDHSGGVDSGGVYIYVKPVSGWPDEMTETAKLTAPGGGVEKAFGGSVSLKGSTLVVGASGKKAAQSSGEVFVFDGSGVNWSHKATFSISGQVGRDRFGTVVDTDGNTIVVGAFGTAVARGSAYVYSKPASGWENANHNALLVASDGVSSDYFGGSVAVDGNTILIGANGNDDAGPKSGSAYLFERSGNDWTEQRKLIASDAKAADNFGYAVDIAGDTLVVGASNFESTGAEAIYLFTRSGSDWTEQGRLTHPDGQADSKFGLNVSVDDSESVIMAGAMRANAGSDRVQKTAGAAYLFELEAQNKAPVAVNDSVSTNQDAAVTTGNVLDNDSDPDGDTLSVDSVDSTSENGGTVVNNGNGTFTYTPGAGFNGSDSFDYVVSDGNGASDVGTVNVTVSKPVDTNRAPVATNDSASTDQGKAVTINVLANDSDPDEDSLSIQSFGQGSNGTVTEASNGLVYTPRADFNGSDSFTYVVSDGKKSATGQVNVTVSKPVDTNRTPVATNDSASTDQGKAVTINVLANDSDPDGDSLSIQSFAQGSNGTVTEASNGLVYTPKSGFNGSDSFSYVVSDGKKSATGRVNVTVKKPIVINNPPVADNDSATTIKGKAVSINVLGNDTDPDGDKLSIKSFAQGSKGKVTKSGDKLTYKPNANFVGKDSFTYNVVDGKGGSDTAKVNVTVEGGGSVCTTEYAPVCGLKQTLCTKGSCDPVETTYSNMCMLKKDNAEYLYDGKCKTGNNPITVDGKVSDWKGIRPIATASDNNQNLHSLKVTSDATKLYFLLEGKNIGENTQLHLNVDNNAKTGYQDGNWKGTGIDYLIENNWLYKSKANNDSWSWGSGDSSAIVYKRSSSVVEVSVKKSAFFGRGLSTSMVMPRIIKVGAWDLNSSWDINSGLPDFGREMATFSLDNTPLPLTMRLNGANPMTIVKGSTFTDPGATVIVGGDALYVVKSKDRVNTNKIGKYTLTYTVKDDSGNTVTKKRTVNVISPGGGGPIVVDGDISDWKGIHPIATTSGNNQNLHSLKVTSDADTIYFLLEGKNIGENTQLHLNVDNNAKTGYQDGNWRDTGVDYLIENKWLYKSTANDGSWSWGSADSSVVVYKRSTSVVEVSIKKSALSGLESTIKVSAWDLNGDWGINSGLPNWGEEMAAYIHK